MSQYLKLANNRYEFGSFSRKIFKGYNQYYQFPFTDIQLSMSGRQTIIQDFLMQKFLQYHFVSQKDHLAYKDALADMMMNDECFWDTSNEELYTTIHKIRMKFIRRDNYMQYKHMMLNEGNRKSSKQIITGIDQSNRLSELEQEKQAVIFMIGDYQMLPVAMAQIKTYTSLDKSIYIVLKKDGTSPLASIADYEYFIQKNKQQIKIEIVEETGPSCSIDFSKIQFHEELQHHIDAGNAFVFGYGEPILLAVKDLKVPAIVYTGADSLYAKSILNLFSQNTFSLVYIPKNFNIFPYVSIVETTKLSYFHLAKLLNLYGKNIETSSVEELYQNHPHIFFNLYNDSLEVIETEATKTQYSDLIRPKTDLFNLSMFYQYKMDALSLKINQNQNIEYFFAAYDMGKDEQINFNPDCLAFTNNIFINGCIFKKVKTANVITLDSYHGKSFRQVMKSDYGLKESSIISNFMFFITANVIISYNNLRTNRPYEQTGLKFGHLDYILSRNDENHKETFPLYNKGCVCMNQDGKFDFFHYELGSGKVWVDNENIQWDSENVNMFHKDKVIVYTPYFSRKDDRNEDQPYTMPVGPDRYNLVIIDNHIITIRHGDVLLPSIGVVISMPEYEGSHLVQRLQLQELENGYYDTQSLKLKIELDPPNGYSDEEWKTVQWAFGGGMTLIQNNICIFDEDQNFMENLYEEGWLSPLSVQTQESEIHKMTRHPRTAIGLTMNNELFIMVFSGRTKMSCGADYNEMCLLAKKYIGDIRYMMNVDGGASSFLGSIIEGDFMELSYPAASDSTCAGLVRNVNSLLVVEV